MVAWIGGHANVIIWKDGEVIFHQTVKRVSKTVEHIEKVIPRGNYKKPLKVKITVNLDKDGNFACPTCVANHVNLNYDNIKIMLDRLLNQTLLDIVLRLSLYYVIELEYYYNKPIVFDNKEG